MFSYKTLNFPCGCAPFFGIGSNKSYKKGLDQWILFQHSGKKKFAWKIFLDILSTLAFKSYLNLL